MNAPITPSPFAYLIRLAVRTSGRNGYLCVRHVYEIHTQHGPSEPSVALTRKDGNPRTFKSREGARAAIRRLRAAE